MKHFTRDNLPTDGWAQHRVPTSATLYRVNGPFIVEGIDGITYCADGYLAHHPATGIPYAVPRNEVLPNTPAPSVPVYLAIGDEPLQKVGAFVGEDEPISNETTTKFFKAAIRNTVDEVEPGPGTIEVPVDSRPGEHGEQIQIGTVVLRSPSQHVEGQ